MITLITGTPGAGKTLYAVSEILPSFEGRPLYVDGIPELKIDHLPSEGPLDSIAVAGVKGPVGTDNYSNWLPDGAVLVVDECQRIWRPRGSGSAVPPGVQAMETHRHKGHDLVLITQHPNLLDANIRKLVGRHLHVRRVWGWSRSIVYEWDHASDPARVAQSTKKTWGFPKKAYGLYKSATEHTGRGQKAPWLLYAALVLPILAVFIGYQVYDSVTSRLKPPAATAAAPAQPGMPAPFAASAPQAPMVDLTSQVAFVPVDPTQPATAPAYESLRQVQEYPRLSCISSVSKCRCYTQQATRYEIDDRVCRDLASNPRYDPYLKSADSGLGGDGARGTSGAATPPVSEMPDHLVM